MMQLEFDHTRSGRDHTRSRWMHAIHLQVHQEMVKADDVCDWKRSWKIVKVTFTQEAVAVEVGEGGPRRMGRTP